MDQFNSRTWARKTKKRSQGPIKKPGGKLIEFKRSQLFLLSSGKAKVHILNTKDESEDCVSPRQWQLKMQISASACECCRKADALFQKLHRQNVRYILKKLSFIYWRHCLPKGLYVKITSNNTSHSNRLRYPLEYIIPICTQTKL